MSRTATTVATTGSYVGLYITVLMLLTGCASSDWSRADTAREITWQIVNAADAYTTAQIQYTPGVIEKQPLTRSVLGDEPKTGETALYFGSLAISHYLVARFLPAKLRPYWQYGSLAYSSAMVINNCHWNLCE